MGGEQNTEGWELRFGHVELRCLLGIGVEMVSRQMIDPKCRGSH